MDTSQTTTADAPSRSGLPALTESRFARFACIILLYFMQGLPVGLSTVAIPAWLAADGATPVAIGAFVGVALLPWSLKLFNGLIMDRLTFRPMGRRRVWILVAQGLMVLILFGLAAASPTAQQVGLLTAFMFALNLCAVFNDVATDGMTVDLVPDSERTLINGIMFASQTLGISATAFVAGQLLASGQMALLAVSVAFVAAVASTFISVFRERPGERLLPWSNGRASPECEARQHSARLPILKGVFGALINRLTLFFLLGLALTQATYGFLDSAAPSLAVQQLGWGSDDYSSYVSVIGLVAAGFGAILIPLCVRFIGLRGTVIAISVSLAGLSATAGLTYSSWQGSDLFAILLALQTIVALGSTIVAVVWAMRICDPAVGASLFALFMAVPNFARSFLKGWFGWVIESVGYGGAYLVVSALSVLGLVCYLVGRIGDDTVAPPTD
ncbi:MAG: MFS transporter [Pseudomonadota bacterium]